MITVKNKNIGLNLLIILHDLLTAFYIAVYTLFLAGSPLTVRNGYVIAVEASKPTYQPNGNNKDFNGKCFF